MSRPRQERKAKACVVCAAVYEKPSLRNRTQWEKQETCSRVCAALHRQAKKAGRTILVPSPDPGPRSCPTCADPLVRKDREKRRDFLRRKKCALRCPGPKEERPC